MKAKCLTTGWVHIPAILLCAIVFCIVPLWNGYPFTFNNDTAVYLESAFFEQAKPDRPIAYGLFMKFVSQGYSLWCVVMAQACILAYVLYLVFRYAAIKGFIWHYLLFAVFVSIFMSASFEVGWLMPDVFTGIMLVCFLLLVFFKPGIWNSIVLSLLLVTCVTFHSSHLFLCLLLCCIILLGYAFKRIRILYKRRSITLRSVVLVGLLAIGGSGINAVIQKRLGTGAKSTHGGPIFLFSNLIEMGVVDPFLAEHCEKSGYRLCAYKDSIPNDFLWSPDSPMNKNGGWSKENEAEYLEIEMAMLKDPGYLSKIVYKSLIYTFKQFFSNELSHAHKPTQYVSEVIQTFYIEDYHEHRNAIQTTEGFRSEFLDFMQNICIGLSSMLYCVVFFHARGARMLLMLPLFIFVSLVINAWFCSLFSGVYSRYQSRVSWLLPLPLFVYLPKYLTLFWRNGVRLNFRILLTKIQIK